MQSSQANCSAAADRVALSDLMLHKMTALPNLITLPSGTILFLPGTTGSPLTLVPFLLCSSNRLICLLALFFAPANQT